MIKFNEKKKCFEVSYSKRHPITRRPYTLRRTSIKTKAEAKRVERRLVILLEDKFRKKVIPTFEILMREYIDFLKNQDVSLKTVESYFLGLRAHALPAWKDRIIDTISTNEIRSLILEKVGDRSTSHQKNVLKYIRSAFNYAIDENYISRNPSPNMKFKIKNKIKDVLTEEQVRILLNMAKEVECEWYPVWATALYTGMRNGELYALTWDKVDLKRKVLKVDCSWNNKDGFKDTKSGDDRIVGIAPALLEVFMTLRAKNEDSNFVLPRIDKWDKGEQASELRKFLEGLGLPRIRFHDLRATWATIMLSRGIEPIKVMLMGGWKDLKTMQCYVRKAGVSLNGITDELKLHNPSVAKTPLVELFR
ncbi:MAG: site-specific integrase [Halobacteriovoraceae bacterium]|nr:site-specific integrase [Halobacteriovoraceae bacterium]